MREFIYVLAIIFSIFLISILLINIKNFFFNGPPMKKTCSSSAGDNCACEAEGRPKDCETKLAGNA
jgi:hypothetical protein